MNNVGAQLFGGEQQLLTIGRAPVTNPDPLILDEATAGLAPLTYGRSQIFSKSTSVSECRFTLLSPTHRATVGGL